MQPDLESGQVAALEKSLAEALAQQTATSEILRVISSSPGELKPMLNAVAERALKLCDAADATIFLLEGDKLRAAARFGSALTPVQEGQSVPLTRGWVSGRAVVDRTAIHVEDLATASEEEFPLGRELQRRLGHHTCLSVPLMREGHAIGVIALWRMETRRFSDKEIALVKTFADQATIAIENVRLFNETKERLEQQTATADILRVISQSPTNLQPVFDTIAAATLKLCNASTAAVLTFDGKLMRLAALANVRPDEAEAVLLRYPMPPGRQTAGSRAILTGSTVVVPDVLQDPEFEVRARSFRGVLSVPLMRQGSPIGAITVGRSEPGRFPDQQIALLQTFADQAVIAIENVRLFNETKEALDQQTATAEILQAISSSPGNLPPVLETLANAAAKFCAAPDVVITRPDGDVLRVAGAVGTFAEVLAREAGSIEAVEIALRRGSVSGRAFLDRRMIHIDDLAAESDGEYPEGRALQRRFGHRTMVATPLLREGVAIGVISLHRMEVKPFSDKQLQLLRLFADQAVIAIENVRLFHELKLKNRDLSEALEHQTATGEILRVISSSPTDVQPVFEIISERAIKLCDAEISVVARVDGEQIHLAAIHGVTEEAREAIRRVHPMPLSSETASARAMRGRAVVHIADVMDDPTYARRDVAALAGWRGCLAVPMLREGQVIGAIFVARRNPGLFADSKIELLKTFADQAVIAIENVRLFTELEARTVELTRSVRELKALGEVGQAVSSTLDLETVLRTIVSRARQLADVDGGSIYEYDAEREEFHVRATDGLPDDLVQAMRAAPIRKGEGLQGRMALSGEPVEIPDIADAAAYQSRVRENLIRLGYRSLLAVPLLRENHILGGLAVNRKRAGTFDPQVTELLRTFATQSALAIQNARLFREIEDKSRQLETASRHKSEFLANMSHELRTPLNAIIGFSEVLSERMFGEINAKQAEYIGDILESGRHLLSLINDILDLSKIEAGRMELEPTEFHLSTAIENTLVLVRERAQRHGITLGHIIDERLGTVRADERKVKQVLLNLLSNALKFTPEGGQISVRAGVQDGVAEISVTDTGVGIAPDDQEMVFEEFRQVGTASKKVEGTGLGLAISRKFIELHGGRIWVNSQLGAGSTFTFTLPLR